MYIAIFKPNINVKQFYFTIVLALISILAYTQQSFISTWQVNSGDLEITIPTMGAGYNYTIDFGDGTVINNVTGNISHSYTTSGIYTVSITGNFPRINFNASPYPLLKLKILSIEQWGDIQWQSMNSAFRGCTNLIVNAIDAPDLSQVTDLSDMFYGASLFNQPINHWDVSTITNMSGMFANTVFNQPLDNWDVSNVTDMSSMFGGTLFNQPINNWEVSSVTNMSAMFSDNTLFNLPLDNWDVSNVANMSSMFWNTTSFNQSLNNWDVSSVTNMSGMFNGSVYNQPLNNWDVSNVNQMGAMFANTTSFNQPLSSWDVSNVTNISNMFAEAEVFNQPVDSWDVSNVTSMLSVFRGAQMFNQTLESWDVSSVTNMSNMFRDAWSFNQPLNNWNVSNVTTMLGMFENAYAFNQPLHNWDISGLTSVFSIRYMFNNAIFFNQDLSDWDFHSTPVYEGFVTETDLNTSNYEALLERFAQLGIENKTLGADFLLYCDDTFRNQLVNDLNWTIIGDGKLIDCTNNFPEDAFVTRWNINSAQTIGLTVLPSESYDYNIDFGDGTIQNNVTSSITHTYSQEGVYTVTITGDFPQLRMNNTHGTSSKLFSVEQWGDIQWESMEEAFMGAGSFTIRATDAPDLSQVTNMSEAFAQAYRLKHSINHWDVSNVENMEYLFAATNNFNQPLDNWDVSNVSSMKGMFANSHFNKPIDNWDVSNVTNMSSMFQYAIYFNQTLNSWNVSNVTNLSGMFENTPFNQPLNNWDVSNVTDISSMFAGSNFNHPLDNWDVSNVTNMRRMFSETPFNHPLNNWNISNVDSIDGMFLNSDFNQPINDWDVSNITDFSYMFRGASSFNQDLSNWQINTTTLNYFLDDSGLDVNFYDLFLFHLASLGIENGTLGAENIEHCNQGARDYLIDTLGWNIMGDSISSDCNAIIGVIRYDQTNNGCDSDDNTVDNVMILANDGLYDFSTFSNNGTYHLKISGTSFTVSLLNYPDYFTATPESATINFSGSNEEVLNFCLTANQSVNDLNITLLTLDEARPGFESNYQLVVRNVGTETVSNGIATFNFDDTMQSFISASPSPDNSTATSLSFELNDINPFDTHYIDITMETLPPPTVNGDDILSFSADVVPQSGDLTPDDNIYELEQVVVNSFDPNDKQVMQGDEIYIDDIDQYLDYRIRFQNTGTASAINVRILDTLHPKLDWNTIQPISASHDYNIQITNGNEVEFIFDNINLPHEADNEPESHGYVAYKIKPKSNVEVGDIISGDASIFFDFNAPIITNMVFTEVVENLGVHHNSNPISPISIYPNPVDKTLHIYLAENVILESMIIYDIQGHAIQKFYKNETTIDVDSLKAGIYLLKVITNMGIANRRLIKN